MTSTTTTTNSLSFGHLYTVEQFHGFGLGTISDSVRALLLDMESKLEIVEYPSIQENSSRHHYASRFENDRGTGGGGGDADAADADDDHTDRNYRRDKPRKAPEGCLSPSSNNDGGRIIQRRLAPQTTLRMGRSGLMATQPESSTQSLRELMGKTVTSTSSTNNNNNIHNNSIASWERQQQVPTTTNYRASPNEGTDRKPSRSESEQRKPLVTTVMPDEQWELIRSFKATKIEVKTGVDKIINDIRIILNKMTPATMEKQKTSLMDQCHQYFTALADLQQKKAAAAAAEQTNNGEEPEEQTNNDEDTQRLAQTIFDITSTNRCYADIYASVMVDLVREFAVFQERLDYFVHHFLEKSQQIVFVDPDVDYDGYCVYVKQSDGRKATAAFISECCKRGIVGKTEVIDIVCDTLDIILEQKDQANKSKEVEELTEMVFILVTLLRPIMADEPRWQDGVQQEIERISKLKSKDHKSLSNRAVFKFMDMMKK